jgi:MFS family permease
MTALRQAAAGATAEPPLLAAATTAGDRTPLGAALCDRLCFPQDASKADSLRSSLLLQAQRGRTDALPVHVSNGNLPWWWLLFCASICVPFQVTFGILSLVLVPAHVATIVGDLHKAKYLGITVTIMMVIQNCQPIFGSISDKTRSRFGRRRPYIIFGQALSVVALVGMRDATTFWPLCWGYQLYQVGNCFSYATSCAVQPGLQENQRGQFGGYVSLSQALGFLGAAVLGYANGSGAVSHDFTYAILIALQFVLLLIGLASFSDRPGFWEPELDEPTAEDEAKRLTASAARAAAGVGAQIKAGLDDVVSPFRKPVFAWLFVYFLVIGVNIQITQTFTQYYLSDVIGGPFVLWLPGGIHVAIANNAESAISVLNMLTQAIQAPLSPVGGWLADQYDRPRLLAATVAVSSACIFVVTFTSSYTVVLLMGVLSGAVGALGGGANYALIADAVAAAGDSSNAARDYTILQTLGANIPGIVVPSVCGSLVTVFHDREFGYRVFWGVAGAFSLLSLPVLVCFVKPGESRAAAARNA